MVVARRSPEYALRRAAILLRTLDARSRQRLLAHLPRAEAEQLRSASEHLDDIDPLEQHRVVQAFVGRVTGTSQDPTVADTTRPLRVPEGTELRGEIRAGEIRAGEVRERMAESVSPQSPDPETPPRPQLQFLSHVSDTTLVRVVQAEHPQTVAVVLGALPPAQAAKLLQRLPDDVRKAAVARLGRLELVPSDVLDDIADHLRSTVGEIEPIESSEGQRTLASIFAQLDDAGRQMVAAGLESTDGIVAAALQDSNRTPRDAAEGQTGQPNPTGQTNPTRQPNPTRQHDPREVTEPAFAAPASQAAGRSAASSGVSAMDPTARDSTDLSTPIAFALADHQVQHILHTLSPAELQQVLAGLSSRDAILTVHGMDAKAAQRVLRRLPRRQAKAVRQQLKSLGHSDTDAVRGAQYQAAMTALERFEPESFAQLRRDPRHRQLDVPEPQPVSRAA